MKRSFLHSTIGRTIVVACFFVGMGGAEAADRETASHEIFALIIGETAAPDKHTLPLRFADDDAFQTFNLMSQLADGDNVVILADADEETRAIYPEISTRPPTRAAIQEAAERLNRKMKDTRSRGILPVFYFFYTGHGNVKNNEGYVTIADGRFFRTDLLRLLSASKASVNHVIIDACKSYFMVQRRGKTTRRTLSAELPLDEEDLPRRTGFFLSTSSDADSHDWELFQGGVFSHEMRSALRGAADLDGNLAVTYEEAAAFINRANASIPAERFRPRFFVRPPDDAPAETAVLTDLQNAEGTRLRLHAELSQHQFIEDGQGIRLLDIHPAAGKSVTVLVPKQRPLFVRFPMERAEISVPNGEVVDVGRVDFVPRPVATRGAEHEAFSRLFALPFDDTALDDYRRFTANEKSRVDATFARRADGLRRSLAAGGGVLLLTGGAMTGVALAARASLDAASSGVEVHEMHERIDATNIAAVICYATGGAALASYLVWTVREKRKKVHRLSTLRSTVDAPAGDFYFGAAPTGIVLGGRF